jgi:hypothetical protein
MKIYTEIQYKWLDDQLVKTSSKSFEYYGSLSLCVGSGGGGGGGTLGDVVDAAVNDDLGSAVEDTMTGTTEGVEAAVETAVDTGEAAVEVVAETADVVQAGVEDVLDATTEGLDSGMDAVITEANLHTPDISILPGGTTKDLLDKFQDTVDGTLGGITTSIDDGLDALGGGTGGPGAVELDKLKVHKGRLKNKNKANLAVNKSKGRARKSLRIG